MTDDPVEVGKQWVLEAAERHAALAGLSFEKLYWVHKPGDSEQNSQSLEIVTEGMGTHHHMFSDSTLDHIPGDDAITRIVERSVRAWLAKIAAP